MRIGFVSAGKLALPIALAVEAYGGHEVWVTDINPQILDNIRNKVLPYKEEVANDLIATHNLNIGTTEEVVAHSEIVFCAPQTPHAPQYEGITRVPNERTDFDYTWLKQAVSDVVRAANEQDNDVILAVISTVLPGTIQREIVPLLTPNVRLVYTPQFIAMGTCIPDFLDPEFILLGGDDKDANKKVRDFFERLQNAPVIEMSLASAELTKVYYNVLLGLKIVAANTLMEICEKTDADADVVTDALVQANRRLISPRYMRGGMGDSGGCHPRDCIALSHLARNLDLSFDLFDAMMAQRERQTDWLARLLIEAMENSGMPGVILGKAYKPETNLTVGSAAVLLKHLIEERNVEVAMFDPHVDEGEPPLEDPAVFFIATKHPEFAEYRYPESSVIIDPWGYIPHGEGVYVKRIGRKLSPE